ncbi:MAG TPA: hypothetical protein VHL11_23855, partial [Phototrophicaceae bacterium]|nr:hypothetical protein [Phototrophicaceae bacterium]
PLHEVLNGRKVDVIIMLATYVTSYQFVETLDYLKSFLAPGGVAVTAFAYQPGIASVARNSMLFRRFAIEPVGAVEDETTIHEIFRQANYEEVGIYKLSDLAREMGKPIAHDIEIIGVGRCK